MVTGASTADAAVLLMDARKGLLEQTRQHIYIAWLLGIHQIVVAVNKMDLVAFDSGVFTTIRDQVSRLLAVLAGVSFYFVPVSALHGDNLVRQSLRMPWYSGPTLLNLLEELPVEHEESRHRGKSEGATGDFKKIPLHFLAAASSLFGRRPKTAPPQSQNAARASDRESEALWFQSEIGCGGLQCTETAILTLPFRYSLADALAA